MANRRFTWIILVALVAAVAGATLARMLRNPQPTLSHGTWLPAPREIASFSMQDTAGARFDNVSLKGTRPTIVFFGYTACPDICPTTLSTLREIYATRQKEGLPDFRVLFVTVDPERDTEANLRRYLDAFDHSFEGIRGTGQQLSTLLQSFGAIAMKVPRADGSYSMDHTATAFWVDREGRYRAIFSSPLTVESLRDDLRRIHAAGAG
jgi:protein SCO1/2